LVIDDEQTVHDQIKRELAEQYELISALDSREGLRSFHDLRPNLVILDLYLQQKDYKSGVEVCRRIREISDVPIIILTQEQDDDMLVEMLNVGADDFIVKGNMNVLKARLNATLRRVSIENQEEFKVTYYQDDELTINLQRREVTRDGKTTRLSPIEYRLLSCLLSHAPRPVPYEELLEEVWGPEQEVSISYLRVYVWHLRKKIEADHTNPQYIKNEPSVGYYFERKSNI
ncbi:MAG: DNA-binding response regulator, partial [Phototrophicales bacterium]